MGKVSERVDVPLELMMTVQPHGENPRRRRRILVVADEADVAHLIRDNPLTEGWEIFTTDAGADVLAYVRDVRPDNILLDITGSRFDGWEIYHRLKEDQETRAIPVIMIAGRFEQLDRVIDFEAGADAIVFLP
jgi:two-component system phosphate regulon response regulator PhoB